MLDLHSTLPFFFFTYRNFGFERVKDILDRVKEIIGHAKEESVMRIDVDPSCDTRSTQSALVFVKEVVEVRTIGDLQAVVDNQHTI